MIFRHWLESHKRCTPLEFQLELLQGSIISLQMKLGSEIRSVYCTIFSMCIPKKVSPDSFQLETKAYGILGSFEVDVLIEQDGEWSSIFMFHRVALEYW